MTIETLTSALPTELFSTTQLIAEGQKELDFVLPGLLQSNVGCLIGPGGLGKSFWALSVALSVATGQPLCGLSVTSGRVLYLSAEDPTAIVGQRLQSYLDDPLFSAKVRGSEAGEGGLENLRLSSYVGRPVDLSSEAQLKAMAQLCQGYRLVIMDTLSRFHGFDENSAKDMKRLMDGLEYLAHTSGAAILFLHHTVTPQLVPGVVEVRGSSVLLDAARWVSFLAPMSEQERKVSGLKPSDMGSFVRWNISKQNFGRAIDDRWYIRGAQGQFIYRGEAANANFKPTVVKE